jgi:hypothetical protein
MIIECYLGELRTQNDPLRFDSTPSAILFTFKISPVGKRLVYEKELEEKLT